MRSQCPFCVFEKIEIVPYQRRDRYFWKHVVSVHFDNTIQCRLCFYERVRNFLHEGTDVVDRLGCPCVLCSDPIRRFHSCTQEFVEINKTFEDEMFTESILGDIFRLCC